MSCNLQHAITPARGFGGVLSGSANREGRRSLGWCEGSHLSPPFSVWLQQHATAPGSTILNGKLLYPAGEEKPGDLSSGTFERAEHVELSTRQPALYSRHVGLYGRTSATRKEARSVRDSRRL